jgi:beta-lactamase superfamily II metal-dependent hydrolase
VQDLPELIILDVGHGNCAILRDTRAVTVIDCGYDGLSLVKTLMRLNIDTVDHVIVSHADMDHIGGLELLLETLPVQHVYLNADAKKMGKAWQNILGALELAEQSETRVQVGLTTSSPKITSGEVDIEILSPSPSLALSGSGGTYLQGRSLDSNTMSVVIGLVHKSCRVALLPGDMSEFSLHSLLRKHQNIEAKVLVFPHHGGCSGGIDDQAFAQKLCGLVKPDLVVFSLHRSLYDNPQEEIVQGVVTACPTTHIMCTQLSRKCAPAPFALNMSHLTDLPPQGNRNTCCGGTIRIRIDGEQTTYEPSFDLHRRFVEGLSENLIEYGPLEGQYESQRPAGPLCLRYLACLT